MNPDNVATPIAASLGDLVTLAILAYTASTMHSLNLTKLTLIGVHDQFQQIIPTEVFSITASSQAAIAVLSIYYLVIGPRCVIIAKTNEQTRDVLLQGWTPGNIRK